MRLLLSCAALVAAIAAWLALRGGADDEPASALSPPSGLGSAQSSIDPRAPSPSMAASAASARASVFDAPDDPAVHAVEEASEPGVIAGRVLVNGRAPHGALRVVLDTDEAAVAERRRAKDPSAPASVRGSWSTSTDARGGFSFADVPPEWSGTLSVSSREDLELGGPCTLVLEEPQAWVELALTSPPVVRGRVLDAATHAPVGGMTLELWDGSSEFPETVELWSDGSFRASVHAQDPSTPGTGRLREMAGPFSPGLVVERFTLDPVHGADLGDLFCARTRPVEVVVRDPSGSPLPGSRIVLQGIEPDAVRTDALWRAVVFAFASIEPRLRIEAEGYEPRIVRAPMPAGLRQTFTFDREGKEIGPPDDDGLAAALEVELKPVAAPR